MKTRLIIALSLLLSQMAFGQIGGEGTYRFLDLTTSARVAALGGNQVALDDDDLDLVFHNPALLRDTMRNQLVLNYVDYFSDIKFGYASYAWHLDKIGTVATGIHFIDYGKFIEAREDGTITGTFRAAEYALNIYWAKQITPRLRGGVNIKPIYSVLETYHSFGLAMDAGLILSGRDNQSTIALVAKNIGTQITTYYQNGDYEKLPFDLQFGFSKRLEHAPLRLMVTARHLTNWDLAYNETASGSTTSTLTGPTSESGFSKVMRHLIFGAELLPSKNFTIRVGYNHQRRKELSVESRPGMVGFSAGFGVRISRFNLSYGLASYHIAGASHHFSISTNLSQFLP
ncbi:type IX secretion system protein PorQ [Prolixibacter denitrificans]|uniref:Type IX secretion system protein PorQ n=2 Tax=Prolixibacter denitrificans TaxID=1541063 RepID=A0A2P8CK51_9BACT|nr:type IX secretion system protein PorQ [Prolixibacter denitrificans]PSK85322.1 hypothetical protein CLV93_101276 [Prolixibacter denitrificans]